MTRKRTVSGKQKIIMLVGAAAMVGGVAIATTGTSQASVTCDGLAAALNNNQRFISDQRANPDANSAARIANREAVIRQIQVQQKESGCAGGADAGGQPAPPASADPAPPPASSAPPGTGDSGDDGGSNGQGGVNDGQGKVGEVVCAGSTVTLSGEGGAPAASSNQFPVGTKLKVTNLDNNKSTTVSVTSASGSCALLNNAAFEQVREPGKFLIRKARIERVG
ncbi:hypothetical protein [Wenjunlia tyrosinilytica]|uniref:Secreted protein n=1 Tax=Wenjunlia tyrosinilytica TaxID=1544741 RepID=A0A918DY16_9ACTN|nr:hypothetical protein [Wenjunlia tyrosinilytica]GGO90633.1 hypothetical protein GCM10012280_36600 [Wenjunlia tyrosinilytica]